MVGIHLLCLGLTRSFNKNNLKNIPLHVKALYRVFVVHKTLLPIIFIGKIEPKEIPSCLIPCLLVVRIQQLEILVTALTLKI